MSRSNRRFKRRSGLLIETGSYFVLFNYPAMPGSKATRFTRGRLFRTVINGDSNDTNFGNGKAVMLRGYAFILTAASCWALIGIFSFVAFNQGIEPMEVAFWRAVLAWLFFSTQAVVQKQTTFVAKDVPLLLLFSLLGISAFYVSYLVAVNEGGAAFAAVMLYTAPAWVIVCAYFIYKEKLGIAKIGAVCLVMAGVLLISRTGDASGVKSGFGWVAVIAGLVSGFCYSLYYTMGKYFSARYSSANLFLYVLPVGALGILPFVDFHHKTGSAWLALLAVSFISTFIANYCYYQGLKYLETGKASIVATIEPVFAAIAAYLVLGEVFTLSGYVGAALILGAVLVTVVNS